MEDMTFPCKVCRITCVDVASWGKHLQSRVHERNIRNASQVDSIPLPPGPLRRSRSPDQRQGLKRRIIEQSDSDEEEADYRNAGAQAAEASGYAQKAPFTEWKIPHASAGANRTVAGTRSDAACKPANVVAAHGASVKTENADFVLDTSAGWAHTANYPSDASGPCFPPPDDPERCSLCVKVFNNSMSAYAHYSSEKHKKKVKQVQTQDGEQFESECTVCNKQLPTAVQAKSHFESKKHLQKVAMQNPSVSLECKLCDKRFVSDVQAKGHYESKKHLQKVEGKPAEPDECKLCMKVLPTAVVAAAHYQSKAHLKKVAGSTGSPQEFTCDLCHIDCGSESNYSMHIAGKKHLQKAAAAAGGSSVDSANGTGGDQTDATTPSNGTEPPTMDEINAVVLEQLRCGYCTKTFTGLNSARDHVQSKKHLSKVNQLAFGLKANNTPAAGKPLVCKPPTYFDINNQPHTDEEAAACEQPSSGNVASSLLTGIEGIIRTSCAVASSPAAAAVGTMGTSIPRAAAPSAPPTEQQPTPPGDRDYVSDALQRETRMKAEVGVTKPDPNKKRPLAEDGRENDTRPPKKEKLEK